MRLSGGKSLQGLPALGPCRYGYAFSPTTPACVALNGSTSWSILIVAAAPASADRCQPAKRAAACRKTRGEEVPGGLQSMTTRCHCMAPVPLE